MKKYINEIERLIEVQIKKSANKTIIIRLDSMENPNIYKEICKRFSNESKVELRAKLSKVKFEEFKNQNNSEWVNDLKYLQDNDFVDFDDAMTRWRNESTEINSQEDKNLVLLMGTEVVEDKGGLEDFYCITPETILKIVKTDYSRWFEEILEVIGPTKDNKTIIKTLFKVIFKNININLVKLSDFIEVVEKKNLKGIDEVVEEICFSLVAFWGIPSIQSKLPKVTGLKKGTLKSAEMIEKSYNFINRTKFNKGVTQKGLLSYSKQIDKFAEEKEIDRTASYPYENPIFSDYQEFKDSLLDFIVGKNNLILKEKFMHVDYGLIDTILALKLPGEVKPPTEKEKKVIGEPIEVFIEMILKSCNEFKKFYKNKPELVEIKVNEVKLSNCLDTELKQSLVKVYKNLYGIVDYLNDFHENMKLISIKYFNEIDPFYLESDVAIKSTATVNELCKINFTIRTSNKEHSQKKEYVYTFKNNDCWINDFMLIKDNQEIIEIPFYAQLVNDTDLVSCESEEQFFNKLQKIEVRNKNEECKYEIECIDNESIWNSFSNLEYEYRKFLTCFKEKGIYSTFTNGNECKLVFERYIKILDEISNIYSELTNLQKEKVDSVLNLFVIADKSIKENKNLVLVPPYHPVMLEKNYYKNLYLKSSFYQTLEELLICDQFTDLLLNKKIDNDFKMSFINSSMDIYPMNKNTNLVSGSTYGKYSVYVDNDYKKNIIVSHNIIENSLDSDMNDVAKNTTKKKSHKSDIVSQNIIDYIKTFPARADGMSLLFVNPEEVQHIVAGIHSAVEILENRFGKLSLNIKVIVDNSRKSTANYLKLWLNNHFLDNEYINIKTYVNYVDFESDNVVNQIRGNLLPQDLTFVYKILDEDSVEFVQSNYEVENTDIKYPAIYTPMPVSLTQANRYIDISQRQFEANNAYLKLTHKILRPDAREGIYRVIKKVSLNDNQKKLIEDIHEKSKWVICLDEIIDKNIININESKIIGFSTGKGVFGELNTTVSARADIVDDIKKKLQIRLQNKFIKWIPELAAKVAENCINISKDLDGSKILKALNPNDYEIHNYLAYVLTMQAINIDQAEEGVVKVLINLDNYLHWFDETLSKEYLKQNNLRPDFLVLEVSKDSLDDINKPLQIKAKVIECKMGKYNEAYLDEAKEQVISGIKKLAINFNCDNKSTRRRYWFNQLYRALIFSTINLKDNDELYKILTDKMTGIYDGHFEIEWSGAVYAYWINCDSENMNFEDFTMEYKENLLTQGIDIKKLEIQEVGQLGIQKALLEKEEYTEDIEYSEVMEIEGYDVINALEIDLEKTEDDEDVYTEIKSTAIEKTPEDIDEYTADAIGEKEGKSVFVEMVKEKGPERIQAIEELEDSHIRFLLGEDLRTKEKIYWEYTHKDLNNRHLLINGNSGSGKTYCIQTLILEAVKNNISVIVFDYTDGFTKNKLSPILLNKLGDKFDSRFVKYEKFPINPFKKGSIIVGDNQEFPELDEDVANRIANSFANVYKFGDQQRSAIYSSVRNALKEQGDNMTLETLREKLQESENSSAKTVLSKIESLVDYNPFLGDSDFSWKDIVDAKGKMYVIQLSGYDREIQVILTELILWNIWNYAVKNGNEATPMPLVLDEAQNLSHGENSPSGKILAEGRKFGVSGWYATQFMAGRLSAGEIGNLQQSAQKLYFSPPEKSTVEVSKYIDVSNEGSKIWAEKLTKLIKGECVTAGFRVRNNKMDKYEPRIIKVTSLEERVDE
ncbi:MAG: ATP-binding protein [Sarcina sp.]